MLKLRTCAPKEGLLTNLEFLRQLSRIVLKWLKIADTRLARLIHWPDRDAFQKTMPECFQVSFGRKVAVIIDCFEIFIERPSNLLARAATWSNYKHHNTAKVLLGITPQGVVSFVSNCWGGQVSDKHLTENSGLLHKLLSGDVVLADRGLTLRSRLAQFWPNYTFQLSQRGKVSYQLWKLKRPEVLPTSESMLSES